MGNKAKTTSENVVFDDKYPCVTLIDMNTYSEGFLSHISVCACLQDLISYSNNNKLHNSTYITVHFYKLCCLDILYK